MNEDDSTTYQNLWDPAKAVLREKIVVTSTYIKKSGRHQINDLSMQLKEL